MHSNGGNRRGRVWEVSEEDMNGDIFGIHNMGKMHIHECHFYNEFVCALYRYCRLKGSGI